MSAFNAKERTEYKNTVLPTNRYGNQTIDEHPKVLQHGIDQDLTFIFPEPAAQKSY